MFRIWLLGIRPKTLAASISPVVLGSAMAFHVGLFNTPTFVMTLLGALLLQIGSNLANDYFDFIKGSDTIDRKGPTRLMHAGLCTRNQMKSAMITVFALALIVGLFLISVGGIIILYIGLVSIACALLYTAGPFPLAYLGLGDLFVFIFFGPLAVCGTYFLQTSLWSTNALFVSLPMGFLSMAILTVNNVRDFAEDKKTNKRTVVVRFGEKYGKIQYSICIVSSFLFPLIYFNLGLVPRGVFISLPLIILGVPMIKAMWLPETSAGLNSLLGETGRFLLLYGLTQSAGWLL